MKNNNNWANWALSIIALSFSHASFSADFEKQAFDCVMNPKAKVELGSAEEGVIEALTVGRGDVVKKGQIVARLDSGIERLAVKLAKIQAGTDVQVRQATTQMNYRQRETERIAGLSAKKVITEMELAQAKVEENLARLSVESSKVEYNTMQVEYERAKERLERRLIRSPVNGIVVDVEMNEGEYAHDQAHLMTLAVVDPLYVEVFVPVTYYNQISGEMDATVVPESPIGGSYKAKVKVVDQVFDAASRTFGVRLLLPNAEHHLPAGLRCKVNFLPLSFGKEQDSAEVDLSKVE